MIIFLILSFTGAALLFVVFLLKRLAGAGYAHYFSQLIRLTLTKTGRIMKAILGLIVIVMVFASCSRAVTPGEAASRHYKSCRSVR
jgi:hypothetical protein